MFIPKCISFIALSLIAHNAFADGFGVNDKVLYFNADIRTYHL